MGGGGGVKYLDKQKIRTVPCQEDGRRVGAVAETGVDGCGVWVLPRLERKPVDTGELEPAELPVLLELHEAVEGEGEHVEDVWLLPAELTDGHALDDTTLYTGDGGEFSVFSAITAFGDAGEVVLGDGLQVVAFTLVEYTGKVILGDRLQVVAVALLVDDTGEVLPGDGDESGAIVTALDDSGAGEVCAGRSEKERGEGGRLQRGHHDCNGYLCKNVCGCCVGVRCIEYSVAVSAFWASTSKRK